MKKKPILKVSVSVYGSAEDVIADMSRFTPKRSNSLVRISIRAKAAEGQWMEDFELPVINGLNTTPAKTMLEGLLRQGRITSDQFAEADKAIDRLAPSANETGYMANRYDKSSLSD